jgi:hypothetical protein
MTSKKYFTDIVVPLNHVSVPSKIRRLAMTKAVKKGTENGNNGDETRVEFSPMTSIQQNTASLECTIMNNSEMQSGTSEILDSPDVQMTTDKNSKTKTGT